MGATTTTSGEPVPRRESAAKATEDRGPPIQVEINYMHYKIGRRWIEAVLRKGRESIKSNYIEHPMVEGDSPPIQRTDKGRIYSRILTMDRGPRAKCMANKHLYLKYYTTLYLWMAYTVSTLYIIILHLPYGKRPVIC